MSDIVLSGKEITFDLSKLTHKQYKGLTDPNEAEEKSDEILARVSGLSVQELDDLPHIEYRMLYQAFLKKCWEPLSDPNSPKASSSI